MRHLTLTLILIGALLAPTGVAHAGDCDNPAVLCDPGMPPPDVRLELNCSTIDIYGHDWSWRTGVYIDRHDDCTPVRASFGRRR